MSTVYFLAMGGSFNPPHLGHLKVMQTARNIIEELFGRGCVRGGFFAAAHDKHVKEKIHGGIKSEHRIRMCELMLEGAWMKATSKTYSMAPKCLEEEAPRYFDDQKEKAIYVQILGADYLYMLEKKKLNGPVLFFSRPGYKEDTPKGSKETSIPNVFEISENVWWVSFPSIDLSSTVIRKQIMNNNELSDKQVHPRVIKYIENNKKDIFF